MNDHDDRTPIDAREERERDLAAAIERLPRAIEPGRDLWPGIAARLGGPAAADEAGTPAARAQGAGTSAAGARDREARAAHRAGRRHRSGPPRAHRWAAWHPAAAAASIAIVAATGFGLWRLMPTGDDATAHRAAAGPDPAGSVPAVETADASAFPASAAFGNRLLAALERKRYQLGPDASSAVEADIARLGLAVAELVAALADHPDEPTLYHQLASRQRQEAELLMRLNRL
jgi:hypothetical protein